MLNIVITGYNSVKWLQKCLESVSNQKYKDFSCIVINDASTDLGFEEVALSYCNLHGWRYIKNTKRSGPLFSRIKGIEFLNLDDNDIIFLIDGDDWLLHENVFQYILDIYNVNDIYLTWGYWKPIDTSGRQANRERTLDDVYIPRMKYIDENRDQLFIENSYRGAPFSFAHPRTFKYILWKNIDRSDFFDQNGTMFLSATDYAFMYPMLEMCGDKFKIIYERLIAYNLHDENIVMISKEDRKQNRIWCNEIKRKRKYLPIILDS